MSHSDNSTDIIRYKLGEYIHSQRGHFHICPECGESFIGRLNRVYCTSKCKIKSNNDLSRKKREAARPTINIMVKNLYILEEMYLISKGQHYIPAKLLTSRGFGFNSVFGRMKLKENGREYYTLANFAFRINPSTQEVLIIKI